MPISELKLTYRRSRQPKQYESQEASVEIGIAPEDGEQIDVEARLAEMTDVAQRTVHGAIGLSGPSKGAVVEPVKTEPEKVNDKDKIAADEAAKREAAKEEEKPKPRRGRPKAAKESAKDPADMDEEAQKPATLAKEEPAKEPAKDPADMDDDDGPAMTSKSKDPAEMDDDAAPPVEVTISTGEMQQAVSRAASRLKEAGDPAANDKVRQALKTFQEDPDKAMPINEIVRAVPELDREVFVKAFDDLKFSK